MKKIFILTGEPSGDKLASTVISKLMIENPNVEYLSVGGSHIKKLGIQSIFDLKEITYLGFTSVLLNIFKIRNRINKTVDEIIKFNPDILFSVDSPDFTLRVAERVKKKIKILKQFIMSLLKYGFGGKIELRKLRNSSTICFYYLILKKNILNKKILKPHLLVIH